MNDLNLLFGNYSLYVFASLLGFRIAGLIYSCMRARTHVCMDLRGKEPVTVNKDHGSVTDYSTLLIYM